ncbi:universal stress protein [Saccharopolyspora phatthalungensis]|uniref:Nucleotide-binding universal stress UspA family protein n=1 Tax=Saccharopolyspora phatthalungensis TaxID=664693 RepID=A0A840QBL4_9PSEU|nr:universal stress protein [Saccharopolyspora phatthalungensis]MBB5156038.1 nucleotide-binding universal stress UspA family protein [Saccharopolyspora phatthalungensis]
MTESVRPMMAGVDGSQQSSRAASWVAADARRRLRPLHLVLVTNDPAPPPTLSRPCAISRKPPGESPGVTVTEEASGHPAAILIDSDDDTGCSGRR